MSTPRRSPEEGAVEVAVGVAGDDATTAERRERGDDRRGDGRDVAIATTAGDEDDENAAPTRRGGEAGRARARTWG